MSSEESETTPSPARLWGFVLLSATLAGLAAWVAGEGMVDRIAPEVHASNLYGTVSMQPTLASIRAAEVKNGLLAFAILGGFVGVALGLAGGLSSRSPVRSALGAAVGLAAGIGVALGTAWVGGLAYRRWYDEVADNVLATLLFHGATWSTIGAVGGLAFGIGLGGRGRMVRGLVGGLLGGWLGTLLFELIGTAAFPMDRTFRPVPLSWGPRLLARMAVAVCVAIGTALALQPSRRGKTPRPEGPSRDGSGT